MKLLFVIGSFYPAQNGGPNNSVYWACRELARNGAAVTVAALKDGLTSDHIKKYRIQFNQSTHFDGCSVYFFDYFFNKYFAVSLFKWLIQNVSRYDMVCLTSFFFPWTWIAALICIWKSVPFCIAPRGELEPAALKYNRLMKQVAHKLFLEYLFRHASFVLVTSKQELDYSKKFFKKDMSFELIPNFIPIPSFTLKTKQIVSRRDILYLGRLHPKKGIENLIQAFALLRMEHESTQRLIIAGTGDRTYVEQLRQFSSQLPCNDYVKFVGHVDGVAKARLYQSSRLLVLPSYSENFGNVVLESLCFGTPVVSSIYTPWSQLDEAGCGSCVDNAPSALAKAIGHILSLENSGYIAMAHKARNFALDNYDISKQGDLLMSLYSRYTL